MRINPINNSSVSSISKQSFRGASDFLVNFWQIVDNGGRAAQFTVEDMCGTNLPRTYKGAMAGYKYTKKINGLALIQEALREFLTGPTMCVMPVVVINLAKKLIGKTADTHVENIKNLSYLMEQTKFTTRENYEKEFVYSVVEDALKNTIEKDSVNKEDINLLTEKILEYNKLNGSKKQKKEALLEIVDIFKKTIKGNKDSYENTDFSVAKYSVGTDCKGATLFKDYVDYTVNYMNDFAKKYLNKNSIEGLTSKNINQFKKSYCGKRVAIAYLGMIGITGFAMSFVPKIYTFFSGNVNPNAKVIYKEADKQAKGGKQ